MKEKNYKFVQKKNPLEHDAEKFFCYYLIADRILNQKKESKWKLSKENILREEIFKETWSLVEYFSRRNFDEIQEYQDREN